ncbi:MAG: DNA-binding beta-propeller fold protein YncE [Candidatus Omnitrophota bacterium]|jgi:DNA-binding beta-propeller fold protein YncE
MFMPSVEFLKQDYVRQMRYHTAIMRKLIFCTLFVLLSIQMNALAMELTGLQDPESVIMDVATGDYYISNVNGLDVDKDGNGYITKILKGELVTVMRFIGDQETDHSLDAPKGMAIVGDKLYIADIDVVKCFFINTGKFDRQISMPDQESYMLTDVVSDGRGNLYISDTLNDAIYLVEGETDAASVFVQGPTLGGPYGLYYDKHANHLFVAASKSGEIISINQKMKIEVLKTGLAKLNGIFIDRSSDLFVASMSQGEIYRIRSRGEGKLTLFQSGLDSPANIALDSINETILIPQRQADKVISIDLISSI